VNSNNESYPSSLTSYDNQQEIEVSYRQLMSDTKHSELYTMQSTHLF